jgi:addiction module RelE/StbE family toxin
VQLKSTELAVGDLDQIEAYIAQENSPVVATDVVLKVIDAAELLLPAHPHAGRPGRLNGTCELVINGVPFIVIYRLVESVGQLQVLRVMHDSQQWPTKTF